VQRVRLGESIEMEVRQSVRHWLSDAWHALDSYVVDSALERGARRRLSAEARQLGYGICLDGSIIWNGIGDQFIQAPRILDSSVNVHGYFDDIADFYSRLPTARNRKTVATSLFLLLGAGAINRDIQAIREPWGEHT
jgi:hypothetical protein